MSVVGNLVLVVSMEDKVSAGLDSLNQTLSKSLVQSTEASTSAMERLSNTTALASTVTDDFQRHLGTTTGRFTNAILSGTNYHRALSTATVTAYRFGDATQSTAKTLTYVGSTFNSLKATLYAFDLVNFRAWSGMERWNTLGVIRGEGRLVTAFDRMRTVMTGMIPPSRQLGFVLKQVLLPAIAAIGTALSQVGANEPAKKLGANLIKIAGDLDKVGTSYAGLTRLFFDNTIGYVASQFNRLSIAALKAGEATRNHLAAGMLAFVSLAAQAAAVTANLTKYVLLAAVGIGTRLVGALISATASAFRFAMATGTAAAQGLLRMATTGTTAASSLNRLGGSMTKTGMAVRSLLGPLAFFGAAGTAIVATAAGLSKGFSDAASIEKYTASMQVMLGTADKAKALLKDVAAFSGKTPFALPELERSARDLVAFGVAADQVLPTMRVLGDLAQGNQESFDRLSDTYGKILNVKQVGLDDLRSIAAQGIPIFDELAKVMGVTAIELRDLVSDGKVQLPQLQQAFVNLTGQGSKFGGQMAKMAATSGGAMTQLWANIRLVFLGIAQEFNKAFGSAGSTSALTTFVQTLQTRIVPAIGQAFQWLAGIVATASAFLSSKAGELMALWSAFGGAASAALSMLGTAFGTVFTFIGGLFGASSATFTSWVESLTSAFLVVEFAILNWKQSLSISVLQVSLAVVQVGNTIAWVFTEAIPHYLQVAAAAIVGFASGGVEIFKKFASAIWTFIRSGFKDTSGFEGVFSGIGESIASELAKVPELTQRAMGETEKILTQTIAAEQKDLGGKWDAFAAERTKQLDAIKAAGAGAAAAVAPPGPEAAGLAIAPGEATASKIAAGEKNRLQNMADNPGLERGTAAAYSAINKQTQTAMWDRKTADATTRTAVAAEEMVRLQRKNDRAEVTI